MSLGAFFCKISSFQIDLTQSIHSGFDEYSAKYQNDEKGVRHEQARSSLPGKSRSRFLVLFARNNKSPVWTKASKEMPAADI